MNDPLWQNALDTLRTPPFAERALPEYLRRCRWFGGKAHALRALDLRDAPVVNDDLHDPETQPVHRSRTMSSHADGAAVAVEAGFCFVLMEVGCEWRAKRIVNQSISYQCRFRINFRGLTFVRRALPEN